MDVERGEAAIVVGQFVALVGVVLLLSNFSPGQSAQSVPVFTSVYWGTSSQGVALHEGRVNHVTQNESSITAYFTVAYSTDISAVSGTRLCTSNSTSGLSTTYTLIQFSFDKSTGAGTFPLSPTGQQIGWVCTYTIKVTDDLSQTTTWLGSVELDQQG